ncbi:deubiquitinase otu-like [Calliopsis andreniformis]|uniref:deubiquitinase otu-like n=1 Tax=Calliopsis andreniformis TaxID=337506 RepID=UPI003FCEDA3D
MEISPRKPSKRAQEPVDEWLQVEGYFRKHAPRDPTCLFRAVSEQIYMTQHYHIRVRKECVEFMRKMRHLFEEVDFIHTVIESFFFTFVYQSIPEWIIFIFYLQFYSLECTHSI